jgi:hypothetical protein
MTGATSGAGTAYPSGAPEFTPGFSGDRITRSLALYVCFVDRCVSFCTFSFKTYCCLFFFDIRILFAPLVSSNSSYKEQMSISLRHRYYLTILHAALNSIKYLWFCWTSSLDPLLYLLSTTFENSIFGFPIVWTYFSYAWCELTYFSHPTSELTYFSHLSFEPTSLGNPTYTPPTLTKEEILDNHWSVLCSFGIPKLHKCTFKQRSSAGSAKYSTKPLSILSLSWYDIPVQLVVAIRMSLI